LSLLSVLFLQSHLILWDTEVPPTIQIVKYNYWDIGQLCCVCNHCILSYNCYLCFHNYAPDSWKLPWRVWRNCSVNQTCCQDNVRTIYRQKIVKKNQTLIENIDNLSNLFVFCICTQWFQTSRRIFIRNGWFVFWKKMNTVRLFPFENWPSFKPLILIQTGT